MSEPFWWAAKKGWYVYYTNPQGQRRKRHLGATKREAYAIWKDSLAAAAVNRADAAFAAVAARWLEEQVRRYEQGSVSRDWLSRVTRTVEVFSGVNPRIRCSQVTPSVAKAWLNNPSAAYERTEVSTLKQVLAWAVREKLIGESPLANVSLPKAERREITLTIDQHRALIAATTHGGFRALLWMAWWTGCRPAELRELRWEQVRPDCKYAELTKHKTARKTGKRRRIYFPPNAQALLRSHRKDAGRVFRNTRGEPWTKNAVVLRLNRLQRETGIEVTAYAYRHSYATRALEQGVSPADLAELLGTSISVIDRHYSHLYRDSARLGTVASMVR